MYYFSAHGTVIAKILYPFLLLNAFPSALANALYGIIPNSLGIQGGLEIGISLFFLLFLSFFFFFYKRPFYIHFSLLAFVLVKRVFQGQYPAALDWGLHGNRVCPKGKGNGNASAV